MSTPIKAVEVSAGGRTLRLKQSSLASYRLQKIEAVPFSATDRQFACLMDWAWALDQGNAFKSPEAMAAAVKPDELPAIIDALSEALEKNGDPT